MDLGSIDLLLDRSVSTMTMERQFSRTLSRMDRQLTLKEADGNMESLERLDTKRVRILSAIAASNQFACNITLGTFWPYISSLDSANTNSNSFNSTNTDMDSLNATTTDIDSSDSTTTDSSPTVTLLMTAILSFSLFKMIAGFVFGYISDKTGQSKAIMIISEAFSLASLLLYVYLNQIQNAGGEFDWVTTLMFIVRVLLGIGAGSSVVIKSQIAASTSDEDRCKAMNVLTIAQTAGIFLAHVTTLGFSYLGPYQLKTDYISFTIYTVPVWIAFVWKCANVVVLGAVFKPETFTKEVSTDVESYQYEESDSQRDWPIITMCVLLNTFVLSAPDFINNMVSPIMTRELNHNLTTTVKNSSIIFTNSGGISLVVILLLLFVSHRHYAPEKKVLAVSILISLLAANLLLIPFQGTIQQWQLFAAVAVIAVATPLFKSSMSTIYSKILLTKKQGVHTAIISIPFSKLLVVILTQLYENRGTLAPMIILSAIQILALAIFLLIICFRILNPYYKAVAQINNKPEAV